jgi:thiamine-monophosphate kinase
LSPGPEFDRIRTLLDAGRRRIHGQEAPGETPTEATDAGILLGPGDDAAVLATGDLVVSTDLTVSGVHFRDEWLSYPEIGYRATTAALSDLAAMAAAPVGVLISLALPPQVRDAELKGLGRGIGEACDAAGVPWIGGDLSATQAGLVLDVTVLGRAADPVPRSGARPGQHLWVTGSLGESAAAVEVWTGGGTPSSRLKAAFARPQARIGEALWLRDAGVLSALIDLSDGLVADARHLAAASGVRITVDASEVPVGSLAADALGPEASLRAALSGGEDYELCFTADPGAVERIDAGFRDRFDLPLTRVGTVEAGSGVYVRRVPGGAAVQADAGWGFDHFADEAEAP